MTSFVPRRIVSLVADGEAACVALLDCGHRRHVRHRPPLSNFPWVASPASWPEKVGSLLECTPCAALSPPEGTP